MELLSQERHRARRDADAKLAAAETSNAEKIAAICFDRVCESVPLTVLRTVSLTLSEEGLLDYDGLPSATAPPGAHLRLQPLPFSGVSHPHLQLHRLTGLVGQRRRHRTASALAHHHAHSATPRVAAPQASKRS